MLVFRRFFRRFPKQRLCSLGRNPQALVWKWRQNSTLNIDIPTVRKYSYNVCPCNIPTQSKSTILMESYKQVRNSVNNLNKKLKKEYFSKKVAHNKGNLKETWKTINLLLNKRSKTTNIESLKVDDQNVVDNAEIAQSMNNFFCSVGEKLSDDIPQQPNPLLSHECVVNQPSTQFRFEAVSPVGAERALKKMKISFGFGSDGIARHFLKIAFPVISSSLCEIYNLSIETDLSIPLRKSNNGQRAISFRGPKLWNTLELDVKQAPSLATF